MAHDRLESGFTADFEALFHHAPAGYLITGADGTILEVNDAFLKWSGRARDTVQGLNLLMLLPIGDRIMYATHALPLLAAVGEVRELAVDMVDAGGQRRAALLSAMRSSPSAGQTPVDKIIVYSAPRRRSYESELEAALRKAEKADQARLRAEADTAAHQEALAQKDMDLRASLQQSRRNEALLNAILDTIDVGIAVVDQADNDIIKNERYQYHLSHAGAPQGDVADDAELLVFGPDRTTAIPARNIPRKRAARGESFTDEVLWVGPADDARAPSFSARTLQGIEGFAGSVVALVNITRLTNAMAVQEEFVANVSHELRTPLTSIMGYLDLVLEEPGLPPEIKAPLTVALLNSERLLQLVGDLLSTTGGGCPMEAEPTDLAELIRARISSAAVRAELQRVSIEAHIPPTLATKVDPLRMGQVIDNLLSNAIKYSPGGGRITITARHTPESITVQVTDTGIGMTEAEVQQAFTKFFRSGTVLKAAIPGAGLGLAITKNIVEAHRGSIALTSEPDRGTTAILTLPR